MSSQQEILDAASRYVNAAATPEERTRRKTALLALAYSSSGRTPHKTPAKNSVREYFRTNGTNHVIQMGDAGPRSIPLELVANKTTRVTVVDDSVLIEEVPDAQTRK